ncbi:MAG: AAA family ATPase, partial [Nevskiaceae bacterium]
MARLRSIFVCRACGGETPRWQGQCPHCEEWNTMEAAQRGPSSSAGAAVGPSESQALLGRLEGEQASRRLESGLAEFDRVLGSGIVPGSVILLGGDPGIGKSTLLLQVAASVAGGAPVLYATGEESTQQVRARARRLGLEAPALQIVPESDLTRILAAAEQQRVAMLVIDSIQTVFSPELPSSAGGVAQLRECAATLVRHAKRTGTAVCIIGHVTREGSIAGPKVLEHLVDT